MKSKKLIAPMIITTFFALLMGLSVFLTFAQEIGGGSNPHTITMFELGKGMGKFEIVLVLLMLACSAISALFALLKVPVVTIVFNALNFCVFLLQQINYYMLEIVPNKYVEYGISFYLFIICAPVVLGCAIWLIVAKKKVKKQLATHTLTPLE